MRGDRKEAGAILIAACLLGHDLLGASQGVTVETLLVSADRYVVQYFTTLSDIVAEERYIQDVTDLRPRSRLRVVPGSAAVRANNARRELRSDVLLVRVGPPLEWRPFRDVFEVDGKPVRDRDDRLARLFLQPSERATVQALRIAEESARYNIGSAARHLNEPGLPLAFLQAALQPRFQFTLDERESGNVWIVRYEERARPTIFRHNWKLDNPSSGRFWIDAVTGIVTRSEHHVEPEALKATFTTRYRRDVRFGVWLPFEMREEYEISGTSALDGTATYRNFRRFEVKTEETTGTSGTTGPR